MAMHKRRKNVRETGNKSFSDEKNADTIRGT